MTILKACEVDDLLIQVQIEEAMSLCRAKSRRRGYKRTAEDCLEMGKALMLLRANSPYADYLSRLELLGIDHSLAHRLRVVAAKFSNALTSPLLKVVNSQSKLLELLILDDTELIELANGGSVRGIVADHIARITACELHDKLSEARHEKLAAERPLMADKLRQINIMKATLQLSEDEAAMLHAYRNCSEEDRALVAQNAKLLAQRPAQVAV